MFKKLMMIVFVGLLSISLAACVGGAGTGSGDGPAKRVEAAISLVDGVEAVEATYSVNAGMGSTLSVRITASPGTQSLETVMRESLVAFSGAADGINTSSSISFRVTESGRENTINPTAVGLPQRPTMAEIKDFARGNG